MSRVIDWSNVESTELYPGIFRQALVSASSTVVRYTYHPGCLFPMHQHPEEQITIVHSGEIEFTVAGERVILTAGQVAIIPGHTPHGARVTTDEVVVTDNYIASARRAPLQLDPESSD